MIVAHPTMTDCPKCYRDLDNHYIHTLPLGIHGGLIERTCYTFKNSWFRITDVCDLCGGSMRVMLSRLPNSGKYLVKSGE